MLAVCAAAATSVLIAAAPVAATAPFAPVISTINVSPVSSLNGTVMPAIDVQFAFGAYSTDKGGTGGTVNKVEYSTDNGGTWKTLYTPADDPQNIYGDNVLTANCFVAGVPGKYCYFSATEDSSGGVLSFGSTYQLRVRVSNSDGSGTSSAFSVSMTDNPSAPVISNVSVAAGAINVAFVQGSNNGSSISKIEYSTDNGTTWRSAGCGSTCNSATSLTLTTNSTGTTLVAGSTYQVKLRTTNSVGGSDSSNAVSVAFGATPNAPVLTSALPGVESISVAGTLGSDNGSPIIRVEYSTDNGTTWRTSGQATAAFTITGTSATGAELVSGTAYQVRIRAVNASGNGTASAAKSATPYEVASPPAITSISATSSSISLVSTLGATFGATVVRVEYSTDNGTTWASSGQATGSFSITARSDTKKALLPGTTYQVKIRTVTAAGNGEESSAVSATPGRTPAPPTLNSVSMSVSGLQFAGTLGFDNGSQIIRIEYSTDNGTTWRQATVSSAPPAAPTGTTTPTTTPAPSAGVPTNFSFTVTAISSDGTTLIDPGVAYTARVRALNIVGASGASAAKVNAGMKVPGAPIIQSITTEAGMLNLTIAFGNPNGTSISDIEYSTDNGTTWASFGSTLTTLTISALSTDGKTPLLAGAFYEVRVRAVSTNGVGASSNAFTQDFAGRTQKIAFVQPTDRVLTSRPFNVAVSANSKLPVSMTSNTPSVCTVSDKEVTLVGLGICSLTASRAASGEFPVAIPVSKTFNVVAPPTLTKASPVVVRTLASLYGLPAGKVKVSVLTKAACAVKNGKIVAKQVKPCTVKLSVGSGKATKTATVQLNVA